LHPGKAQPARKDGKTRGFAGKGVHPVDAQKAHQNDARSRSNGKAFVMDERRAEQNSARIFGLDVRKRSLGGAVPKASAAS